MSLILDGTNGLTFNNATTQNSGGKVIQVVNATTSTPTTVTTSTFTATALTASITPLFSTSKILIFGQIYATISASTAQPTITLYKGASAVFANSYGFGDIYTTTGGYSEAILSFSFLDSPATTSNTTYTIYGKNASGLNSTSFGDVNRIAVITLMEIVV
jgi:hypothetical protein